MGKAPKLDQPYRQPNPDTEVAAKVTTRKEMAALRHRTSTGGSSDRGSTRHGPRTSQVPRGQHSAIKPQRSDCNVPTGAAAVPNMNNV